VREKGTGLPESDSRLIYMILRVKVQRERKAFGENKWGVSQTNRPQSSEPGQERVEGRTRLVRPGRIRRWSGLCHLAPYSPRNKVAAHN
jgi:hypothetical protein